MHASLGQEGEMGIRTQASIPHQHIPCLQAWMDLSHQGQIMGEEGCGHQRQEESGARVEQPQQPYHGKAAPRPLHVRLAARVPEGRGIRHRAARAIDEEGAMPIDDRGQGPPGGATPAGLCSGAKLHRPGPLTSGAHCDQPLWAQGADQAREGPGREGAEHRAPRQTKAAVGGPQGLAGHLRSHLAVAQAPRRSPRAPGAARGTRQTPAREDRPDGPGRQGSGASDAPDRGKSPDV